MCNLSYVVYNYIDDFMSIDREEMAWRSYKVMGALLRDLGVKEAEQKSVPPSHIIEFLGILFDIIKMTISIPKEKIVELEKLLNEW